MNRNLFKAMLSTFLTIIFICGFLSTASAKYGDNLVVGGKFDIASDMSNFRMNGTKSWVSGGADGTGGCLKNIPAAGSFIGIDQDITLKTNTWYILKGKIKLLPNANGTEAKSFAKFYLGSAASENLGITYVSSESWTQLYTTFKAYGINATVNDVLRFRAGQNEIEKVANGAYVDDIEIIEIDQGEMILNGDFENEQFFKTSSSYQDADEWSNNPNFRVDVFYQLHKNLKNFKWIAGGQNGNDTAHILAMPAGGYISMQANDMKYEPNTWYLATANLKLTEVTQGQKNFTNSWFRFQGNNDIPGDNTGQATITSEGWTRVYCYFKNTGSAIVDGNLQLRVGQNDTAKVANGVFIDDFKIEKLDDSKIVNADFEITTPYMSNPPQGDYNPWKKSGNPTISYESVRYKGDKSLFVVNSNENDYIYQQFLFKSDIEYELSARVKLATMPTLTAGQFVKASIYAGTTEIVSTKIEDSNSFKLIQSYQNNLNANAVSIRFVVTDETGTVDANKTKALRYYIDDVKVEAFSGIIKNATFESGISYWDTQHAVTSSVSGYNSDKSLYISPTESIGQISQNVSLKKGKYYITLAAKGDGKTADVMITDHSDTIIDSQTMSLSADWTVYNYIFDVANDIDAIVCIQTSEGCTLDNIDILPYAPLAKNLQVAGITVKDYEIIGSYEYQNLDGMPLEGSTQYEWYVSENGKDNWIQKESNFTNANTQISLYLSQEYENQYLELRITPMDDLGNLGKTISSNPIYIKPQFVYRTAFQGSLTANTTFSPDVNITNNTDASKLVTVILAVYDDKGRMENIAIEQKDIAQFSDQAFTQGVVLGSNVTGYSARLFVYNGLLDSVTDMVVLVPHIELK